LALSDLDAVPRLQPHPVRKALDANVRNGSIAEWRLSGWSATSARVESGHC
jgi:hypothetical protein